VGCSRCGSAHTRRDGVTPLGGQRWRCRACRRRFTTRSASVFAGHSFPDDLLALAVRWYVRSHLSYGDGVAWVAERGVPVDRTTVDRWVRRFLPLVAEAARTHRHAVGAKWRGDETYCRLNGKPVSCFRVIDEAGQVVDASVSDRRNAAAARAFFEQAMGGRACDRRA
jgi:transposase-like protein